MPKHSFTKFFENLLDHSNITVRLGIDALGYIKIIGKQIHFGCSVLNIPLVYSGALDELFEFKYGRLPYRSLQFEWKF